MKRAIPILLLLLGVTSNIFAQSEDEKYGQVLKEMMQATGSEATFKVVVDHMIDRFKQRDMDDIPDKFWDEIGKELFVSSMTDLVTLLTPVYQKHLTMEDLQAIIDFYNTPVGKKYATKNALITQESMEVGQEWAAAIGEKLLKKLQEEGY